MAEGKFVELTLPSGQTVRLRNFISANGSMVLSESVTSGKDDRQAFLEMLIELSVNDAEITVSDLRDVPDEDLISIGHIYIDGWNELKKAFEESSDEEDFFSRFVEAHNKVMALSQANMRKIVSSFTTSQLETLKETAKLSEPTIAALKRAAESTDLLKKIMNPANSIIQSKPIYPTPIQPMLPESLRNFGPASVKTNGLLNELLQQQDKNQEIQQVMSETLQRKRQIAHTLHHSITGPRLST